MVAAGSGGKLAVGRMGKFPKSPGILPTLPGRGRGRHPGPGWDHISLQPRDPMRLSLAQQEPGFDDIAPAHKAHTVAV